MDAPRLGAGGRPTGAVLVRALRDRELRRAAARLAADAVVLARTMEDASARAARAPRKGRRKLIVLIAGAGAVGLAVAARAVLHRG
ncbi:MAG: hypothetical protein ACM3QU_16020 [Verrucomicrobiota bacterium]